MFSSCGCVVIHVLQCSADLSNLSVSAVCDDDDIGICTGYRNATG